MGRCQYQQPAVVVPWGKIVSTMAEAVFPKYRSCPRQYSPDPRTPLSVPFWLTGGKRRVVAPTTTTARFATLFVPVRIAVLEIMCRSRSRL